MVFGTEQSHNEGYRVHVHKKQWGENDCHPILTIICYIGVRRIGSDVIAQPSSLQSSRSSDIGHGYQCRWTGSADSVLLVL
jgi:hypothetical protein